VTAKGEQQSVDLCDGSRIVLNTDTALTVHLGGWTTSGSAGPDRVLSQLLLSLLRCDVVPMVS
jgi:hypothetical protein